LSGGVRSLLQVPRWNADRRARSAFERAPHPMMRPLDTRLSAFRLLFSLFFFLRKVEAKTTALPMSRIGPQASPTAV
jgi:hypothetical protein